MNVKNKIVYGIAGLLAFLPLSILVIIQSIFALEASYDSKLVIDADEFNVANIIVYDAYNNDITDLADSIDLETRKPILFSIIEATNGYLIIDFHGGEIADQEVNISGIQFIASDSTKSELLRGIVYLQFKNVAMDSEDLNYSRDAWLRDFIEDMVVLYEVHYEQPVGTIPYIWFKIIMASVGTVIGLATVLLIVLRKSTKALVKRYWRISVLVALIEGTIILGLITWIIADIFQVFAAATVGWLIFLGVEKFAKIKGYLEVIVSTDPPVETLQPNTLAAIQANVESILLNYKK